MPLLSKNLTSPSTYCFGDKSSQSITCTGTDNQFNHNNQRQKQTKLTSLTLTQSKTS